MTFRRVRGTDTPVKHDRFLSALFVFLYSMVGAAAPARATVAPSRLYFPVGYADPAELVVVVEGYLADPCHKIRTAKVIKNRHTFEVYPQAENHGTDCE